MVARVLAPRRGVASSARTPRRRHIWRRVFHALQRVRDHAFRPAVAPDERRRFCRVVVALSARVERLGSCLQCGLSDRTATRLAPL